MNDDTRREIAAGGGSRVFAPRARDHRVDAVLQRGAKRHERARYTGANIDARLSAKEHEFFVARDGNSLVGFCEGSYEAGVVWVEWIGVTRAYRRRRVATDLLRALLKRARRRGGHKAWCDSRVNNAESVPMLRKLGFKPLCAVKNHWYGHDFYLWEKKL